jgi:broad-specificity NMP kinase
LRTFGERRIVELDVTGRTPQDIAADIISNLQKKSKKQLGIVDWLAAVYERGDAQKLLEY